MKATDGPPRFAPHGGYRVVIRRDGPVWWWHVVGEQRYGHAVTERRARRKAARAIEALGRRPARKAERWDESDVLRWI